MSQAADFVTVRPAPPFSTGDARKAGSQVITPQYAMSTLLERRVAMTVRLIYGGVNISPHREGSRLRSRHNGGSSTVRRMKKAAMAGSAPTRNRIRQL